MGATPCGQFVFHSYVAKYSLVRPQFSVAYSYIHPDCRGLDDWYHFSEDSFFILKLILCCSSFAFKYIFFEEWEGQHSFTVIVIQQWSDQ